MIEITVHTTVDEPIYDPDTGDLVDTRTVSDRRDLVRFPTAAALAGWLHDEQLICPSEFPEPTGSTWLADDPDPEGSTGRMVRRSVHPVTVESELWVAIVRVVAGPSLAAERGGERR